MQTVIKENRWGTYLPPERYKEIATRAMLDDERFKPAPLPAKVAPVRNRPALNPFRIGRREFRTITEAAEYFDCSTATVHRALKSGTFTIRIDAPVEYIAEVKR